MSVEIRNVADGLWLWRRRHPAWREGEDWQGWVSSFAAESRGVAMVIDALAPPPDAREACERLDALGPDVALVLKPDHVRDVDLFVRRYGAKAYGPHLFWPGDVPRAELQPIFPGDELSGGVVVLREARERTDEGGSAEPRGAAAAGRSVGLEAPVRKERRVRRTRRLALDPPELLRVLPRQLLHRGPAELGLDEADGAVLDVGLRNGEDHRAGPARGDVGIAVDGLEHPDLRPVGLVGVVDVPAEAQRDLPRVPALQALGRSGARRAASRRPAPGGHRRREQRQGQPGSASSPHPAIMPPG